MTLGWKRRGSEIQDRKDNIRRSSPLGGRVPLPPPFGGVAPSPSHIFQERRWMEKMIDTHLYPHGPYAMGALDYLSDVIVYYINVSTN
jgi:hypothetical protein